MIAAAINETPRNNNNTSPYYFIYTFQLSRGKSGKLYWKGFYYNYWMHPWDTFFSRQSAIEEIQQRGWLHLGRADNRQGSFYWFKESDLS